MWVGRVELRDFRNHRSTSIALQPGITLLIGRNGQGKTNFVEALVYLATMASYRVSSDAALVRLGAESAIVRASVHHDYREVTLALEIRAKGTNRAKINGDTSSITGLLGWLKVVLFAPEDLDIVRGDPSVRRRFLDELTVSLNPAHHEVLARFDRLLRQRNALLKSARGRNTVADELAVWDDEFAGLSARITSARQSAIALLVPEFAAAYQVISPGDEVALSLDSPLTDVVGIEAALTDGYRIALQERRGDEIDRGVTMVGPHRDDLTIQLKGLLGRTHASHGEAWSLALALKIALAEVIRGNSSSGDPVLILDDVLAELDDRRRATVVDLVSDYEQVLITAAVEEDIPATLHGRVLTVSAGEVTTRD